MANDASVMVVGAQGFVGRHVADAFSRLLPERPLVLLDQYRGDCRKDAVCVAIDIVQEDRAVLVDVLARHKVKTIINCAGAVAISESVPDDANVVLTERLLDAASSEAGMLFVQIGSAAEYEMLPRPAQTAEDCPPRPNGAYGAGKLEATKRVLMAVKENRVQGLVLRLFNPLGPGMSTQQLVGRMIEYLRGKEVIPISVGSLDSYRDYVDVRDVASAIVKATVRGRELSGEVINLGSGKATHTRVLVERLLSEAKRSYVEDVNGGSLRSRWNEWQEADISKAIRLLGWSPQFSLDETIARLLEDDGIRTAALSRE